MGDELRSVRVERERCRGRMVCLRACPTEAIRVRQGRAFILEERCIDCGECVRACPNGAIQPLTGSFTDFARYKYTIALPSPALYSQFRREVLPGTILRALKAIGFDDACDLTWASEAVSVAMDEFLAEYRGPLPLISPFCPAVVRLVQARFPALVDHLIPMDSPMEIAAREIKTRKARELGLKLEEIGVIYVTPCPAKILAVELPPRKPTSYLDGAIAIADIYQPLLAALAHEPEQPGDAEAVTGLGLGWPVLGGQAACLRTEDTLAVGGLRDVARILEDVENGKLSELQYLECHACPQGCCSGPLTVENPYLARSKVLHLVARYGTAPGQDREHIRQLYRQGYFSLPGRFPPQPFPPLDAEIPKA
ncbi:MAG: [Fe-Fe] hydrogenase large subunit C-terminal domain-containing protein, partial [Bryobacteraceae bacterium]